MSTVDTFPIHSLNFKFILKCNVFFNFRKYANSGNTNGN